MHIEIVVIDGNDMIFFESIKAAEDYIEPYDVSEYRIFDREGNLYHARAEGMKVHVLRDLNVAPDQDSLKNKLYNFLHAIKISVSPTMSIDELFNKTEEL